MNWMMIPVILAAIGASVHGGGLLVWAILLNFRGNLRWVPTEMLIRVYRGWGPVSGVALGIWILGALWRYPLIAHPGLGFPDCYKLGWGTLVENLTTIRAVAFGLMWVNYTRLEVWILEPCRQLDKDGEIVDRPKYEETVKRVSRQLALNALLFLLVAVLGALGARP